MRASTVGTLAFALAALTGCDIALDDGSGVDFWGNTDDPFAASISSGSLRSRSSNFQEYDGVYLPDARAGYGVAGMIGMTCQLYTSDGFTGTDVDVNSGSDHVDDGKPRDPSRPDLGVLVLGHGDDDVTITEMPSGNVRDSWSTPGVVSTKFDTDGGFYVVRDYRGDCLVDHHDRFDRVTSTEVDDAFCDGDASVEATPDGLVLADTSGSVIVDATGSADLGMQAHTLTYSDHMHGYHASKDTHLSLVDESGLTVWRTDLGARVVSHADLGAWQVASLEGDSTNSRLVVVDSATGEVVSDQDVDRRAGKVYGSDDGRTVIVSSSWASDVYSLE